jgi:hypothetical protein
VTGCVHVDLRRTTGANPRVVIFFDYADPMRAKPNKRGALTIGDKPFKVSKRDIVALGGSPFAQDNQSHCASFR